jgi:hypothetical protein
MDLNELKFLSDEDKDRYMKLERLWSQPGWALVIELAAQLAATHKDRATFAQTWEANRMALGSAFAYDHISRLQELTEAEFEQKVEAARTANRDADEEENE